MGSRVTFGARGGSSPISRLDARRGGKGREFIELFSDGKARGNSVVVVDHEYWRHAGDCCLFRCLAFRGSAGYHTYV